MASNIDQLANDIGELFRRGAEDAMKAAKEQPDRFSKLLDDLADTPGDILDRLKQQLNPPDWLSLMILIALQLKKIIGDPLEVGVWTPKEGWAKGLLLTYTQDSGIGIGRLKLAICLGGEDADINGLVVIIENTVDLSAGNQLKFKADSNGDASLFIPFGRPLEKTGNGRVSASIALATPKFTPDSLKDAGIDLTVGRPTIGGEIDATLGDSINWNTFARIGNPGPPEEPGLEAKADLSRLLGGLAAVIHIDPVGEIYKPSLTIRNGATSPEFNLNHKSGT
ncbi:UNVERIFIED_ORG: hypothetical protein GGI66_006208 [Rhizobium esperanzae]